MIPKIHVACGAGVCYYFSKGPDLWFTPDRQ